MKFKITYMIILITVIIIIFFSFNYHPATMSSVQKFAELNPESSAYSPPATTISYTTTSGKVGPYTLFTLTPTGATSTAWAAPSEKNDMDFAGYSIGSGTTDIATVTNWSDFSIGTGYTAYLANWPQTNSWSNYSSTNTGSGYNKICVDCKDTSSTYNPSANFIMPGYIPTGNVWYYISYEIRVKTGYSGTQSISILLGNAAATAWGNSFQFYANGSIGIQARYSLSTSAHTSVTWSVGVDYFVRLYFNPATFMSYWALNGTIYNNGGNYWPWSASNVADMVLLNFGGNNAGSAEWYLDNFDFSWQHTFPASSWNTVTSPYTFTLGSGLTDGSTVYIGYNSTGTGGVEFTHLATVQYNKYLPTTTISYTPAYTSGSTNWVNASTQFTLSESGGSTPITTAYAIDTQSNLKQAEDFQYYTVGQDFCSPSENGWMAGGQTDPTCQLLSSVKVGKFVSSSGVSCQPSWTLPGTQKVSGWNYIESKMQTTVTPSSNWVIWLESSSGSAYIYFGFQSDGKILMYTTGSGSYEPLSYSINTWYWFRAYWDYSTGYVYFKLSTDGTTWTTYNNGGSYYTWDKTTLTKNCPWTYKIYPTTMSVAYYYVNWYPRFPYADWTSYGSAFNLGSKTDGTQYIIGYNSTANSVLEATNNVTVMLDKSAPATTISYKPAYSASPTNFVNSTTKFALSAADGSGSGVKSTGYAMATSMIIADQTFGTGTVGNDVNTLTNWTDNSGSGCAGDIENWPAGGGYANYGKCLENIDGSSSYANDVYYNFPSACTDTTSWHSCSWEFRPDTSNQRYGFSLEDYAHSGLGVYICFRESSYGQYIQFEASSTNVCAWTANTNIVVTLYYYLGNHTSYFSTNATGTMMTYYKATPVAMYHSWNSIGQFSEGSWNVGTGDAYIDNIKADWIYTFPAASWTAYSTSFNVASMGNGTVYIGYNSTDNAGNVETTHIATVRLDTIAPTTGISYTAASLPNIVNHTTRFTLTPNDNTGGSGIASTLYQYNNSGGYNSYTAPFTLSLAPGGTITIKYYSTDRVGNVETAGTLVVVMVTNPVATSTPSTAATVAPNSTYSINWTLTSFNGTGEYRVTMNNTAIVNWKSWPSNPASITVPINTNIGFGRFNYTIYYNDSAGLNGSPSSVIILIDDRPTSTHPLDNMVVENSSIYSFSWYLYDVYPGAGSYNVYRNGSSMSGWHSFISGATITVNTDPNAGCFIYNYTIAFHDNLGLNGTPDSVLITVNDHPRVNALANFVAAQGTAGVSIPWIITDKIGKAGAYRVDRNQTLYINWTSFSTGVNLNVAVNTTVVGYWNYTIVYHDVYNLNGTQGLVWVIVDDYPTSTSPPDVVVVANATGEQITWTLHDTFGGSGNYNIYRNGTAQTGWTAFVSGASVSVPINTNIGLGRWNYTIKFNDTYGLYGTQDTVLAFVDTVPVAVALTISPVQFYQNTTGHSISWKIANFAGTGLYRVLLKGAPCIGWTTWVNNTAIVVPVSTTIGLGTWNYTIQCNDFHGIAGVQNTTSVVIIPDTTGPLLGNLTSDAIKLHDTPVTIKCDAFDNQSGIKNVVLYYKPAGVFLNIVMAQNHGGNTYQAVIPGLPFGTIVLYYIQAMDNASNTSNLGNASNPYSFGLNYLQTGFNSVEFTSPLRLHVAINVVIPGNLTLAIFNASDSLLKSLNISTDLASFDLQFTGTFSGNANLTCYYSGTPTASDILVYHQLGLLWVNVYRTIDSKQGTVSFSANSFSYFVIGVKVTTETGFNFVNFIESNWLLLSITVSALIVGIVAIVTVTRKKKAGAQPTTLHPKTKELATENMTAMEKKIAALERYQKLQYVPPPTTANHSEGTQKKEEGAIATGGMKICYVHKGIIRGLIYSCPQCNTFYCLNCATTLASNNEECWNCGHKIELDAALTAEATKQLKSGKNAVFYCISCTQYHEVENPDFVAWENCPVCSKPMVYSKRCPSCNRTIAVNKDLYTIHKDLPIPCPNCKKDIIF